MKHASYRAENDVAVIDSVKWLLVVASHLTSPRLCHCLCLVPHNSCGSRRVRPPPLLSPYDLSQPRCVLTWLSVCTERVHRILAAHLTLSRFKCVFGCLAATQGPGFAAVCQIIFLKYSTMSGYGTFDVKVLRERRIPGVGPFSNGRAQIRRDARRGEGMVREGVRI